MSRKFTGRHMALAMVSGFGIVAAVNFYMASRAVGGFHGVTVENTYVASQKFNGWMEEAKKDQALGWGAGLSRDGQGHIRVHTQGVPEQAVLTAELRRPIGMKEFASLTFMRDPGGNYRSTETVGDGRWTVRLTIHTDNERWDSEGEIR